jgi:hypothetical protein
MIVAINGQIRSGKDSVFKIWHCLEAGCHKGDIERMLVEDITLPVPTKVQWIKKMFAGKLKEIVALMFNIPVEKLEDEAFKDSLLPDKWQVWECYQGDAIRLYYTDEEDAKAWAVQSSSYAQRIYKRSERTFRWALQHLGTQLFRDGFHREVHILMLREQFVGYREQFPAEFLGDGISEYYHHNGCITCGKSYSGFKRQYRCRECIEVQPIIYPTWFITDMRFENEYKALDLFPGKNFKIAIRRPFAQRFPEYAHLVDTAMPFDIPTGLGEENIKLYKKLTHESETELQNATFFGTIINDGTLAQLIDRVEHLYKQIV